MLAPKKVVSIATKAEAIKYIESNVIEVCEFAYAQSEYVKISNRYDETARTSLAVNVSGLQTRVRANDWVVKLPGHKFIVLHEETFNLLFAPDSDE